MKKNAKYLTFFDVLLILLAVLLVSLVVYSVRSGEMKAVGEVPLRIYARYLPLTEGEGLPEVGEAVFDENGTEWGRILSVSPERDGSVYVQLRAAASLETYEKGSEFCLETKGAIRRATVVEVYVEEKKS